MTPDDIAEKWACALAKFWADDASKHPSGVLDLRPFFENAIQQAVAEERERCAKIGEFYAEYAKGSPAEEWGGFKDPAKMAEMAERIAKEIRAGGEA